MPKRRMTAKRIVQIRNWQRASYSAPRARLGNSMGRTKKQHVEYHLNSGIPMPHAKKHPPVYYSGHQARIMSVGYGYPKKGRR